LTPVGTGSADAAAASSPNVAFRLLAACSTTPSLTAIESAGTFHR
jgi:hypothetical protein